MSPVELVLSRLPEAKRNGRAWQARCPTHDDHRPSLFIAEGDDGRALIKCHAGCSTDNILAVLGLTMADLMPGSPGETQSEPPRGATGNARTFPTARDAVAELERRQGQHSAQWRYTDADGELVGLVIRWDGPEGKTIRPVSRTGKGWLIGAMPALRPLYRLPQLGASGPVYVVEGEKCVEAAESIGLVATTSPGGANAAEKADWAPLAGREVMILPDTDQAGRQYAQKVAQILSGLEPPVRVKIVELPGLPEGGDLADYVEVRDSVESEDIRAGIEQLAASVSFLATIVGGLSRKEFPAPVPASELGGDGQAEWLWDGYLTGGAVTLLAALWKAGKSTLVGHLIKAMEASGRIGGLVRPGRVLVVSEESKAMWARRRDDLGLGNHAEFICRPFKGRPRQGEWMAFIDYLTELTQARRYQLVAIDTLAAMTPCSDENDASKMMLALAPLHRIAEAGAALLLVHHLRKGDGSEGRAARGSGALLGFVDIIVELRRYDPERREDRRRALTAFSRYDETPAEIVLELTDTGYVFCGTRSEASQQERQKAIHESLPSEPPGLKADEVRGNWPALDIPKPSLRTLQRDLKAGAEDGHWAVTGQGKKSSPHRYYRTGQNSFHDSPTSIGTGNETEGPEARKVKGDD